MRKLVPWIVALMVVLGIDQGSKAWARGLSPGPHPVISGVWDWDLAYNHGAAFSSLQGGGTGVMILLGLVAAGALVAIGIAAARTEPEQHARRFGYALVAGGALGNLVDRVRDGAVTDFIRWRLGEHMWPIFNVADAALLVGVVVLLIEHRLRQRAKLAPAAERGRTMPG